MEKFTAVRYLISMAVATLKSLLESPLAVPVSRPPLGRDEDKIRAYARDVSAFEEGSRRRIAATIENRLSAAKELENIVAADPRPEVQRKAVDATSELVSLIERIITEQKKKLADVEVTIDQKIGRSAVLNPPGAKQLRKLQKRIITAQTDAINALIDTYYFLLALRSQFDVDAGEGKRFTNPDDLAAYLREQIDA